MGELNSAADVRIKLASSLERSSLGELVVDATLSGNGVAHNSLELGVLAENGLVGVREVGVLNIAAHHELLAGDVDAGERESVCVSHDAVDNLRHDLLHGHLVIGLDSNTNVDILGDLEVDLGLDGELRLLVSLNGNLKFNLHHTMRLGIQKFLSRTALLYEAEGSPRCVSELKRYLRSC